RREDFAVPYQILGDVQGKACLLVDDLASTGRTLAGAARTLISAGATEVHAMFTHAVMAPGAIEALLAAPLGRLVTTDSIPHPAHARLETVSLVGRLAQALRELAT